MCTRLGDEVFGKFPLASFAVADVLVDAIQN
jgi:hypothetical protein